MGNDNQITTNNEETTKECRKCGRILPLDQFRVVRIKGCKPYHRSECRDCEEQYNKEWKIRKNEKNDEFSENIEILFPRKYKEIHPARILDLSETGLNIELMGADEIFVRLMDCRDTWLSNYGRMIRRSYGKYNLLKGNANAKNAVYSLRKPVYEDEKWISKEQSVNATKAVIQTFIVNPDIVNNTCIWHRGDNKKDNYYKNLYPVTPEQYAVIQEHFSRTGDDSEEYILKVMNDIRFKTDDWSRKVFKPVICGVGYHGCNDVDFHSEAYFKWKNMIERCYNQNSLRWNPAWEGCTVCDEWLNFSNFRYWYEAHKYKARSLSLDKDILMKGNTVYCPEFCSLVPKDINQLMISSYGKERHGLPIGVYADSRYPDKYRAEANVFGRKVRLGTYDTPEEAFQRYKDYKEAFIRKVAESRKGKIPYTVCDAMLNWQIEITD